MYGLVGAGSFSLEELVSDASETKRKFGMTVDNYDEEAYKLGFELTGDIESKNISGPPTTIADFCKRFKELLVRYPGALKESSGKNGDYNSLKICRKCKEKTKEIRHGGNSPGQLTP